MKVKLIERGSDNKSTREITVQQSEFLIGRGSDCDLGLTDTGISRHHCILRISGDEACLVDLGSSNGSYRNGQRVRSQATLTSGDEIGVGPYRFFVDLGDRGGVDLGKSAADAARPTVVQRAKKKD